MPSSVFFFLHIAILDTPVKRLTGTMIYTDYLISCLISIHMEREDNERIPAQISGVP